MSDVRERVRAAVQCRMTEAHVHGASSRKPADHGQFEKEARETADLILAIVGEWQPIEGDADTSKPPWDGARVLVGWWHQGLWVPRLARFNEHVAKWHQMPGAHVIMPTHWRPLPEPQQ